MASSLGVYLYDAGTLGQVYFMEVDVGVRSISFSPDGNLLAVGTNDGRIQLWEVSSGTLIRSLKGHYGAVEDVTFSPSGELLASGSGLDVRLWRVADGELIEVLGSGNHPALGRLLARAAHEGAPQP